jgi:DNA-binding transcriptional regulator YhcF (GntR family)
MRAKQRYRNRDETEVAVLDALADRNGDGMTVFELRAKVEVNIDTLEDALAELKDDGLIDTATADGETMITVEDRVIGPETRQNGDTFIDEIRRRFPF